MRMKSLIAVILVFLSQASSIVAQKQPPLPKPRILTAREIAERVLPSVVLIITQDENGNPLSQGSGFVYEPGLVVSNLHVFERATTAIVKNVKTGEVSKVTEVVGMNARQDICVVRIASNYLPVIPLGDSFEVRTGDDIYVASNPKGLEGSFTKGIISSVRESDRKKKGDVELLNWAKNFLDETDKTLFQIDAAISPGSSGGAVINARGEAIGIVRSSVVSGQNLNFAIPIDQLLTLEMKFKHPVLLAGACAYNDRLKAKLRGSVKTVSEKNLHGDPLPFLVEYDIFGNNIKSVVRDEPMITEFDENGLIRSVTLKRADGTNYLTNSYSTSEAIERKLKERQFSGVFVNPSSPDARTEFNSNGELVRFSNRNLDRRHEYDSDGRLIRVFERSERGSRETVYNYRLDQFGNWIERTGRERISSGRWSNTVTIVREITYYR